MPLKTFHVQHFYSLQEEHQAEAADQILMRGLGTAMVLAVVLCATVLQGTFQLIYFFSDALSVSSPTFILKDIATLYLSLEVTTALVENAGNV